MIADDEDYMHEEEPRRQRQPTQNKIRKVREDGAARDAHGNYLTNKSNKMICPWFSRGECDHSSNGLCPYDPQYTHQCYVCLQNTHGGDAHGAGKGKMKGKGKGKGK